jgi:hypothetical protein
VTLDALRHSIAQEEAASAPPKREHKHIEGQGEMLLPISGKKVKDAVAKPTERSGARQKKAASARWNRPRLHSVHPMKSSGAAYPLPASSRPKPVEIRPPDRQLVGHAIELVAVGSGRP